TDGRFSGATHGLMVGHVAPEAAVGGPIAAVRNGDMILIDAQERRLELKVSDDEIKRRLSSWKAPEPRYTTGVLGRYARLVSSASKGAVLSEILKADKELPFPHLTLPNFCAFPLAPARTVFQPDVPSMPATDHFSRLHDAFAQWKSEVWTEIFDRVNAFIPAE